MKYFSITIAFLSQRNWIVLFLPSNVAAVQTLYFSDENRMLSPVVNNITLSFNPSTPESDQFQISLVTSPEILCHTVWRTWLSIAHSDKTVDDYISLTLPLPRVSNFKFPCSLTRNITSHSMKNLAFHSLLRWKMIILPILTTSFIHFSLGRLGECTFWTWDWKGCRTLLKTTLGWRRPPG